jgi:hypothetical protein
MDNHSSLLQKYVIYDHKKFYSTEKYKNIFAQNFWFSCKIFFLKISQLQIREALGARHSVKVVVLSPKLRISGSFTLSGCRN